MESEELLEVLREGEKESEELLEVLREGRKESEIVRDILDTRSPNSLELGDSDADEAAYMPSASVSDGLIGYPLRCE